MVNASMFFSQELFNGFVGKEKRQMDGKGTKEN